MANVVIDIAAEFTGKKAFKQAETATDKLTRNVKQLAGAIGLSFGTAQVLAFGKAAVKASLEAQAQQERLANLVKVTVGATDAQVQSLNDQAEALQAIGVVNKENITQTQSQLATFNLQIDTIKQLTPAILDYVTAEKGAAASADQFKQMTNGLAQALNGNFASLTKVGFVLDEQTKKTIKSGTETERAAALVKVLDSTYKDFNKNLANTPTGQMQKLANAADDAKQIIGTGLLDALKGLGEDNSVQNLADNMTKFATETANVIRGIGKLIEKFQQLNDKVPGWLKLDVGMVPIVGAWWQIASAAGSVAAVQKASDNQHLKSLQYQFFVLRKSTNEGRKLTAEELKQLKARKLKAAIDKANLALNKGEEVFDMDKIQIAAALTSQAEQLGKATSSAQVLQIANDTARLNVKQSILALEDAIAAKDEQAIVAATAKLNADLRVLGALTGQNIKLQDIKSILDSLQPKDLINLANLDAAIAKMMELLRLQGTSTLTGSSGGRTTVTPTPVTTTTTAITDLMTGIGQNLKEFTILTNGLAPMFQTVEDSGAFNALVNSYAGGAINPFNAGSFRGMEGGSLFSSGAVGSRDRDINITIQANTIANPDELTNLIQNSLIQLNRRGDSLVQAGAL